MGQFAGNDSLNTPCVRASPNVSRSPPVEGAPDPWSETLQPRPFFGRRPGKPHDENDDPPLRRPGGAKGAPSAPDLKLLRQFGRVVDLGAERARRCRIPVAE